MCSFTLWKFTSLVRARDLFPPVTVPGEGLSICVSPVNCSDSGNVWEGGGGPVPDAETHRLGGSGSARSRAEPMGSGLGSGSTFL